MDAPRAAGPTEPALAPNTSAKSQASRRGFGFRSKSPQQLPRGTAYADAQLQLYARLLPSGFLHYGYFADTRVDPATISLAGLEQAQLDYAEKIIELITDRSAPALDVGCGMGGLSRLLHQRGVPVVALTPDRHQAAHLRDTLPEVEMLECRFEKIPVESNAARFGTLITSESLQYLRLHKALPLIDRVLKPGGRWIACDYFRLDDQISTSGHLWDDFVAQVERAGLRIVSQQDITPNVLPSLAFFQVLGQRFVQPIAEFAVAKLEQKRPWLHRMLGPVIRRMRGTIDHHLLKVDPVRFAKHKRYVLLAIERA